MEGCDPALCERSYILVLDSESTFESGEMNKDSRKQKN